MDFLGNARITIRTTDKSYPVIIQSDGVVDCISWAKNHKVAINDLLLSHGAILIKGLQIDNADNFSRLFTVLSGEPMEYKNRSSPREPVYNHIYTSTSHPADQVIHMHTENSYAEIFNRVIAFYCLISPYSGGETPIADERKLEKYLGEDIIRKFRQLKIMYVRNIFEDVGLSWKTIYQTSDKLLVGKILENQGMEYSWISDKQLRVKWTMSAFQKHPLTNENLWFNHMYFGNKFLYDPIVLEFFKESDLPFSTYYGDGSQIERSVIEKISKFYVEESFTFKWEKNDFLLLDNMMFAHGRHVFKGNRLILTAMGQPTSRNSN